MYGRNMVFLLLLTLLGSVLAVGCGEPSPKLTARQIAEKALEVGRGLQSYEFQADTTTHLKRIDVEEQGRILAAMTGQVDTEGRKAHMLMTARAELADVPAEEQQAESYLIEDTAYSRIAAPKATGWRRSRLPEGAWQRQDMAAQQAVLLEASDVSLAGEEKVDGVACYILDLTPDKALLWTTIGQMFEELREMPQIAEAAIKEVSLRQWIDKESFLIRRIQARVLMRWDAETVPSIPRGEAADVTQEITMVFRNHNRTVSIEVPAEALAGAGAAATPAAPGTGVTPTPTGTRFPTLPTPVPTGTLVVRTALGDVAVHLDGEPKGNAGTELRGILPGTYTLRLTKPGYREWSKRVEVKVDQTTEVTAYLEAGTGTAATRQETIGPDATFGSLEVGTDPSEAAVFLDGEYGGKTSAQVRGILPGTYTLRLALPGHKEWSKQVEVRAAQTTKVTAYLEVGTGTATTRQETIGPDATFGSLDVATEPDEVAVYVAGEYGGETRSRSRPAELRGLLSGTYMVQLAKPGYKEWSKQVEVKAAQTTKVFAYLEQGTGITITRQETISPDAAVGSLTVSSVPWDASVYVAGEYGGKTPAEVQGLPPGTYTLRLALPGHKEWSKQVKVKAAQNTKVFAYLEQGTGTTTTRQETIGPDVTFGTLSVESELWDARVFLDGEYGGQVRRDVKGLLPGTYALRVAASGHKMWEKQVEIQAGRRTNVWAYLEEGTGSATTRQETIGPDVTFGTLRVESELWDARVFLDGEYGGQVRRDVKGLLPGTYALRVAASGHKMWEKQVEIQAGRRTNVWAYLEEGTGSATTRQEIIRSDARFGVLAVALPVTMLPRDTRVYMDGEYGGQILAGNITVEGLLPGTYTLRVAASGHKTWDKQVEIQAAQRTKVWAYLEEGTGSATTRNEIIGPDAQFGSLVVTVFRSLAGTTVPVDAEVYVDGEYGGQSPYGRITVEGLPPGSYSIRVVRVGYKDWTAQVEIRAGGTAQVTAHLEEA